MSSTASLPAYLLPGVPVCQPPHLEGDVSFATEILPGPPPIATVQSSLAKRDPKKPATMYSYLPASDPGTTYSGIMHGTLIGQDALSQRKRPTGVEKSSSLKAVSRAQRAEARSQNVANSSANESSAMLNENTTGSQLPASSGVSEIQMIEPLPLSRSASVQATAEPKTSETSGRPRRKDKGKAREVELIMRIKEEPRAAHLNTPEPIPNLLNNNDHCSSCRSQGALVYCDGCPRAFHLSCLDPPMESIDEGDSNWFCPACMIVKCPPEKLTRPSNYLDPVLYVLQHSIPTEYQLPDDIRTFFKDVGTGPRGAYVDKSEIKPPRLNRHGQLEDRDAHQLRDRNGHPVLCFRCGTSALSESVAATAPSTKRARKATPKAMHYEVWKDIISCDYCNLHWHLDCLDPPLSSMPVFSKKWMCPNHAERIIPMKRRIPKQNAAPIEIIKPSQWNNGNIEVLESDLSPAVNSQRRVEVDEVLINGRRYRVPERIILLDFWNKLNKNPNDARGGEDDSGMSSPLTSLSSLEEDEVASAPPAPSTNSRGPRDLEVAQMLFDLQKGNPTSHTPHTMTRGNVNGIPIRKELVSNTPPEVNKSPPQNKTTQSSKATGQKRNTTKASTNGIQSDIGDSTTPTASAPKRRRSVAVVPPTRELRSRSKNLDKNRTLGEEETLSTPPLTTAPSASRSRVRVKVEEPDISLSIANGAGNEGVSAPVPAKKVAAKRARISRKKDIDDATEDKPKEKKSRKRKEREDDTIETTERPAKPKEKKAKSSQRLVPPSTTSLSSVSTLTMTPGATSTPPTPSLKIRLPRLNLHGSPVVISAPKGTSGASTRLS